MDKGIGFNRNIKLDWLDTVAAFCTESSDATEIRIRLEPIIRQEIKSPANIRKAIDILLNIWFKQDDNFSHLQDEALSYYREIDAISDRLWLHYGLTLIAYPFFSRVVDAVGQIGRYEESITSASVKKRIVAELGQLGSLDAAVSRIIFSLRDWGILKNAEKHNTYAPQHQALITDNHSLETWLLSCALQAHAAEEIPLADLLNLPLLFPFRFTVGASYLRQIPRLEIQRQGFGLDMVRIVS